MSGMFNVLDGQIADMAGTDQSFGMGGAILQSFLQKLGQFQLLN
jgi:hypothetical protein